MRLYRSAAVCRLVMVSGAAKMEKMQVLLGELGVGVLHIWKLNLNVPPPLSPPSLI